MPVNLSIKNVPDELADRLRKRAERSHRSLQGELLVILEEAVAGPEPLSPSEALQEVRRWGLVSGADGVEIIRADRDGR